MKQTYLFLRVFIPISLLSVYSLFYSYTIENAILSDYILFKLLKDFQCVVCEYNNTLFNHSKTASTIFGHGIP